MNAPFLAAGRLEQFKKTRTEWVVRKATIELKFENQRICWSFLRVVGVGQGLMACTSSRTIWNATGTNNVSQEVDGGSVQLAL